MQQGKELLDSPDMQKLLSDPSQMRDMMLPFVEMMGGDKAKLEEVLADPSKLRASMNEGLETISELFTDPSKLENLASQMIEGLDPATRGKVERLASGDEDILTELLAELDPDGSLKELVAGLSDPFKLEDPDFIDELRQKLLANEDMASFAEKLFSENPDVAALLGGAGIDLGDRGGDLGGSPEQKGARRPRGPLAQ